MALLKLKIDFGTLLISAEGARLLQEDGTGIPRRRFSAEEASRTACGKRSARSANQQKNLTQPK
jgi:hypothetical protein